MTADEFGPAVFESNKTNDAPAGGDNLNSLPPYAAVVFFAGPMSDLSQFLSTLTEVEIDLGATDVEIRLRGDANRDGVVDGQGFDNGNTNKFGPGNWGEGEINGDGQEVVMWITNKFQSYNYPAK